MATQIIIVQVLIFSLIALIGVVAHKVGIFSDTSRQTLARIIIDITLPFLIFSTFTHIEYKPELFKNAAIVFVLALLNLLIFKFAGTYTSKLLKLNKQQTDVYTLHSMFGNIVFFGFPLLDALFPGGTGVFYGTVYQLVSNAFTFTYGVYRFSNGTQKRPWLKLLNPNTAALAIGIVFMVYKIKVPEVLSDSFTNLGKCTSPLSMIYIGALLASMKLNDSFKTLSIYILSFSKLLFMPVIISVIYLFSLQFLGLGISREPFIILILQAAMPCQTIIVVMSQRYNSDYKLAAGNLFITSVLSIITLPIIFVIVEYFYKVCFL